MPRSSVQSQEPDEQSWMKEAAAKIARENKSIMVVVDEMGIEGVRPQELDQIYRSRMFQTILRSERNRYALEVAGDPSLRKDTAVGFMMIAINNLMAEGEWDKALEGLQKLSKLAGWQGTDGVNIFADLKPSDFEELRKKVGTGSSMAGVTKANSRTAN